MEHEKLFKRENGVTYAINVKLATNRHQPSLLVHVLMRGKRKHTWESVGDDEVTTGKLRYMSLDERSPYMRNLHLGYVTQQEIDITIKELLDKISKLPIKHSSRWL